ncbi:hypothetical protein [Mariniplasma anaerobium]|uniref:Uncharacterized protein n=1 Tax=Mariniplasma anaerobium TaxID=2735436 RepID=A0A7U9XVN7_9MOLU|nr:hypothetical protein [Mariniplasma anaerobium]BCR36580.1 hypothetical protein MPAN_014730 [Mariniplasma anaerobium]
MLDKINNKLSLLTIVVGIILLFDMGTIVSNIYVSPILEGYGLPDIFIYLKTSIFLFIFIVLMLWQNKSDFELNKSSLRIMIYLGFFTIIAYFFSLFMYKYVLLYDTAEIIRNNILYGNPNLVFDFSAMNYKTLSYITTIFGGFNSEAILFVEALIFQMFLFKSKDYVLADEKKHQYDVFLYDMYIYILFIVLAIIAFLSINLFTFRYDELGSIEMGISILGFIIVASGIIPAYNLYQSRSQSVTKSFFKGTYKLLFTLVCISLVTFIGLFILNIVFLDLNRGSYRIVSTFIGVIVSIVLAVKIYLKMSLDNK